MKTLVLVIFAALLHVTSYAQSLKIGFKYTMQSSILNEIVNLTILLPHDYNNTDKSYPVMYRLNGDVDLSVETAGTIDWLTYVNEIIPEMIVVMIEPTNRNQDLMPVNTNFFRSKPNAQNFKLFLKQELIPHINSSYRTKNEKILCGQSLSSIFALFCFLTSPDLFDSYIACSGGFPGCEDYFSSLSTNFLNTTLPEKKKLFITYGEHDPLDTDGTIKQQLISFTQKISSKENLVSKLKIYKDEGHVPYQSLYHALKFIYVKK